MRDIEKGRDIDRGRSMLPAGSLMRDSIPGPWDHDLSQRQMLNHGATQVFPVCELTEEMVEVWSLLVNRSIRDILAGESFALSRN